MNSRPLVIGLLALSSLLSSCSKKTKNPPPNACGGLGVIATGSPVIRDRLEIQRITHFKKVKNCTTGQIETRKTQGQPKNSFQLKAQTLTGGSNKAFILSVFNRSTCQFGEYKGSTIKPDPIFMVKAHTSPGTSRMHVVKNKENFMDYEIRECVERVPGQIDKCAKSVAAERGTVVLAIEYSEPEVMLEGIEDTCTPPTQ